MTFTSSSTTQSLLSRILPHLPIPSSPQPLAIMTCGLCGSGKSTFSTSLVRAHPEIIRISIDANMFAHYGSTSAVSSAIDTAEYEETVFEAVDECVRDLERLLKQGRSVVVDNAFFSRRTREEYKALVERCGGRWMFVVFRVEKEVLWGRIELRNRLRLEREDVEGLHITRETLERYWDGFEWPVANGEEGEVVFELQGNGKGVIVVGLAGP